MNARDLLDLVVGDTGHPGLRRGRAAAVRQAHRRAAGRLDRDRTDGPDVRRGRASRSSRCSRSSPNSAIRSATASRGSRSRGFRVDFRLLVDPLSATMILFVTGVGTLIHLYSIGYMHGDARFSRFFAYMNLFAASMLVLVLGSSFLVDVPRVGRRRALLVPVDLVLVRTELGRGRGQEGVRHEPRRRLRVHARDVPDLRVARIAQLLGDGRRGPPSAEHGDRHRAAPARRRDRQERPDPAAHLAARRDGRPDPGLRADPRRHDGDRRRVPHLSGEPVLRGVRITRERSSRGSARSPRCSRRRSPSCRTTSNGCSRTRRSASSATCSSRPASARTAAAMFHMITHAFFKALLFLGAGSVIHGMHDEQDMRRMGGLRKFMPITAVHLHRRVARDRGDLPVRGLLVEGRDPRQGLGDRQLRAVGHRRGRPRSSPRST